MSPNSKKTGHNLAAVQSDLSRLGDELLSPLVRVPPIPTPPTIDGVFSPGEWDHAFMGTGVVPIDHWGVDPITVHYWFTYDSERIYLAARMKTPPGECYDKRPRRLGGETVSGHFEFLIDPNPCNPDTNWVQAMLFPLGHYQNVGYSQRVGGYVPYDVDWDYKDSWDDGWWTVELSAPADALNHAAIMEGGIWSVLFAGAIGGPGWFSGTLGEHFALRSRYLKFIFDCEAPVVQIDGMGDIGSGCISPSILVKNTTGRDIALTAEYIVSSGLGSDGIPLSSDAHRYDIPRGSEARLDWTADLPAEPGQFTYMTIRLVEEGATSPIYEGVYRLSSPRTPVWATNFAPQVDPVILNTNFYPYFNRLRAVVDFGGLPEPSVVTEVVVEVADAGGTIVAYGTCRTFDNNTTEIVVSPSEPLPEGEYFASAMLRDKSGNTVAERKSTFTRKQFPFEHNTLGVSDRVLHPWTPIKGDSREHSISVWNRTYRLDDTGLPAEVVTAGKQVLAQPIVLRETVDGVTSPLHGDGVEFSKLADHEICAVGRAHGRAMSATVEILGEYDGMLKYEVTLTGEKGARIDALDLVIPLKESHARFLHATGDGCRSNYSHALPEGEGVVWDSTSVMTWVMPVSWLSYAWLGDYERGLCWWADSAEGWTLPGDKNTPTVEIVRRDGVVELVFHIISRSATVLWADEAPRRFVFALEATPIKPRASWARDIGLCDREITKQKFPQFAWLGYGQPGVWWTHVGRQGNGDPSTFGYLRPFDGEAEGNLRKLTAKARSERRKMLVYCDFCARALGDDETRSFAAEWSANTSDILGHEMAEAPRWRTIGVSSTQSRMDYDLWVLNLNMDQGIECWYFDEIQTIGEINPITYLGYQDEDGKWMPTMRLSQYRQFWKRLYTMMQERGETEPVIVIHNTSTTYAGPMAFCTATWDLEEANPDHFARHLTKYGMDYLVTEVMGHQYGFAASTLGPADLFEPWLSDHPEERDSAERHWMGVHMLLDMTPYLSAEGYTDRKLADSATTDNPFLTSSAHVHYGLGLLGEFGWNEPDCRWVPFWKADEDGLFTGTPCKGVYSSAYVREGKSLVILLNDTNQDVVVDWRANDNLAISRVFDAEGGVPIEANADGVISVAIPHFDYRALVIPTSIALKGNRNG